HPHARGRKISPHAPGRLRADAAMRTRDRRYGVVGELHEWRVGLHQAERLVEEIETHFERLVEQRQARDESRRRLVQHAGERVLEAVRIALNDMDAGKALAQMPAK